MADEIIGKPAAPETPIESLWDVPVTMKRSTEKVGGINMLFEQKIQRSGTGSHEEHGASDMRLAQTIGVILQHHYPGHFWAVEVDSHQGIYTITIPVLLGNWKYMQHLSSLSHENIKKAGGELLERFKIPRSGLKFGIAQFQEARKHRVSSWSQRPPE